MSREVIAVISDLHAPYNHKDALPFLAAIKQEFKPTQVINVGDEVDYHSLSFHASDPDLDSAGPELDKAITFIKKLEDIYPEMDLLHSNHGSMVYRKAKFHGVPRHVLKSYNDVLGVSDKWKWHTTLTVKSQYGDIFCLHQGRKNAETYAKSIGCNVIMGHFHEDFRVGYTQTPKGTLWGLNVGCLIDDTSLAFDYNKVNPYKPVIGTVVIFNGKPILIPMGMDSKGNWDGRLI